MADGRRVTDQCSAHCYFAKQWEETKTALKDHDNESKRKLAAAAPLWSVILLVTIVIGSALYTFQTAANITEKVNDRMIIADRDIKASLQDIKVDIAVFSSTQKEILRRINTHMTDTDINRRNGGDQLPRKP